jgi:pilus assembly protein CpaE
MSMMPLTAAFVISNRTLWESAHSCIQNLPVRIAVEQGMEQGPACEADALLDRIERHRVDVVLVEASRVALPLEEFVRRLRNTAAQPAVFVLHTQASPELILEALRAGANEFIYPPLGDTLRDAFERLSETRAKGGSENANALGKIFGFLSARGGCGASTLAVHVAPDIARQTKQPLLVADFDFDAGLLRFLMKSRSTYSVRDALDNLNRMDASLWKALVTSHAQGVDFIPAPDEVAAKRRPGREEITHLMRFVRSNYPVCIVDFGRSVSMAALDALPELELLYLVTTPDAIALEQAKRAIRIIEERGLAGGRLRILVNRIERGKTERQAIEETIGRPCDLMFRNDYMSLYDAYSEGQMLPPGSALAKEIHELAESIRARAMGERDRGKNESAAGAAQPGVRRWFSFLHRNAGLGHAIS